MVSKWKRVYCVSPVKPSSYWLGVLSESVSGHGKIELKAMINEKIFKLWKVENSNLVTNYTESFTRENLR